MIEQMNVQTLHAALADKSVILIDVREPHEYETAAIEEALLIPLSHCYPPALPANPDKAIVFQCAKGGRSQRMAEHYAATFPGRKVYNLAGGIEAWITQGYPVTSKKE